MGCLVSFRPAWAVLGPCYGGEEVSGGTNSEESPLGNQKRGRNHEGMGVADMTSPLEEPYLISGCLHRQRSSGPRHGGGHSLGLLFLSGNGKACQMLSVPEKGNTGSFQVTRELDSGGSAAAKSARAKASKKSCGLSQGLAGQSCSNTAPSQSIETHSAKSIAATNHRLQT